MGGGIKKINMTTGGADASTGQSTAMTAGSVTVSTTAVTANSLIQLTHAGTGTAANFGVLSVGTITPGTSFVINSLNASDDDAVNWSFTN